jgi:hypothetical protein
MLTLEQISDEVELRKLVIRYANAIDARQFDELDRVFTPDADIDYSAVGGMKGKYPAIKSWLAGALQAFPAYMHLVGNQEFVINGDGATGQVACINPMVLPLFGTVYIAVWYNDRYVRTADGWRISERVERCCHMPRWMRLAAWLQRKK